MPNSHLSQDPRAVVADIAIDIEATAMRAHEQLNGNTPYSMSCPQFKLAATYPPAPAPRNQDQ